jgi:hypothetical protein
MRAPRKLMARDIVFFSVSMSPQSVNSAGVIIAKLDAKEKKP